MRRLTAIVSGKVQQVGYRARIVDIANALGLRGMVENRKDGTVKIIAEGDDEKLKWFESAIDSTCLAPIKFLKNSIRIDLDQKN